MNPSANDSHPPVPTPSARDDRPRRRRVGLRPAAEALEGRALMAASLEPVASFGTDGVVSLAGLQNPVSAAVAQPDGKVVAVGQLLGGQLFAERFDVDGSLDPTFGTGGVADLTIAVGGVVNDAPQSVAVQPDGKIVVVGSAAAPDVRSAGGVTFPSAVGRAVAFAARLNPDGSPDASFGAGGTTTIDFATGSAYAFSLLSSIDDSAQSVLIRPDGRIVVGGGEVIATSSTGGTSSSPILARLNSDGSLDGSFGSGGKALPVLTAGDAYELDDIGSFTSLGLEPNGQVVAAGMTFHSDPGTNVPVVERLDADGSLDATFGIGGGVTARNTLYRVGDSTTAAHIAVQGDGKVVVGGTEVTRLDPDGSVDATFAAGNPISLEFNSRPYIGADGRITLIGDGLGSDPYLERSLASFVEEARLNPDGSFDPTLGAAGVSQVDGFGGGPYGIVSLLRPDGSLIDFQSLPASDANASRTFELAAYIAVDSPPRVTSLVANRDRRGLESVSIAFSEDVAGAGVTNPSDYAVRTLNRKGKAVATSKLVRVVYDASTHVATITLKRPISNASAVQVTASGASIAGTDGLKLAGDGANPGSTYVGTIAVPAKATHSKLKR